MNMTMPWQQIRRLQQQQGVSLVGLIFILAILIMLFMLGAKVAPVVIEYRSIRDAIFIAKKDRNTVREIQQSFDNQKISGYFEAISGSDLEITKDGNQFEVSFAYQKKIPLFGPVSLVFDFEASTAPPLLGTKKAAPSSP